ncbi:phage tail tape measure protein [Flagellimonas sp.]|uniref:phage tail tape measure protein n=1 Tax=Flagellimonas sp. TaxID=2058762 RepID=UPI003BAD3C88
MAQNDRITEIVSPKAQEQVIQLDANLRKILATYNELAKESQKIVSVKQGNDILKKRIQTDQEAIKTSKLLAQQKKAEADAEAARQRAIKAGITTENAKERAQRKSIGTGNTNLQQIRSLNSFYQQQSRLLNKLRDDYKSLEAKKQLGIKLTQKETVEYRRLSVQVRALDSALKRTDAAAGQFQRNVGNYAKGTRLLVGSLRSLAGAFGFTSGIYIFAGALSNAFKRVRDFDKSMQNLAGVLRTTRGEISDVEDEIIRVAGASIKTSREVAGLAESLATLGLRGQDLINLIKPANDLSIALGTSSDEAAEFLVQNLNAFGASSDEAAKYADTIATIRTSTSLDFQRMRDSFQYLAPISRILGEDIAYTGGVIGLLSDNGLKAEQAARLLGTAQQKLAKEGLSLTDALNQINEAQANGAEGLELLSLASNLFGKQAAKVGVLLATNQKEIQRYADTIRNSSGALDDLVNEQLKSLDAQIKILDSTWERLILTIENGEGKYARFFKGVTLGITGYLEELTEVEEAQSKVFDSTGAEGGGFVDGFNRSLVLLTGGLVNINTEYDKLVEQQREFNRLYNTLGPNTTFSFLKDEMDRLNTEIRENNDLTDEQKKLYFSQVQRIEELYNANRKTRNELEEQAYQIVKLSGHFEDFGSKIDVLTNEQLKDFINQNKGLLKSIQDINDEFEGEEFTSLDSLNEKLKALKERYSAIDIESDEFQTIKKEIEDLEAFIASLTEKNRKDTIKILEGTVAAYQKEISELEKLRDTTAKTNEEYEEFNDQIFDIEQKIKLLTEGIDELNKVQETFQRGIIATSENPFGAITVPDYTEINQGLTNELIKQEEKKNAVLNSLRRGQIVEFERFTDEETKILEDALDLQLQLRERAQQAAEDLVFGGIQAIFDARVQSVDDELDELNDYYDTILDRENLTQEERQRIQRQKEIEEDKLKKKREEREKQAFLVQQGIAIAQIAIDLAKTIAAINLTAAVLDSISFGTAGTPYRAANIPIAITTAALQTGLVLAQTIPQFFKGKEASDNYQGLATVNELPGQREVKIDKYGGVTAYKAGMQFDYIKSDDIIIPSMSQFNREVKDPDSDVFKRLSNRIHQETAERVQMVTVQVAPSSISTEGIRKEIRNGIKQGFKGIKPPKYPDNYTQY